MSVSPGGRRVSGEAGFLLVVLLLTILTVIGIALSWVTDTERVAAAFDWSASRALYAADAGVRWACAAMRNPAEFLARTEFRDPPDPFGSVRFPMPAHRHGPLGPFSGDPAQDGIRVEVHTPGYLGRRPCPSANGGGQPGQFFYSFEIRVEAAENASEARFFSQIVADVEIGPLPQKFLDLALGAAAGEFDGGDIITASQTTGEVGSCEPGTFRSVVMNWREP